MFHLSENYSLEIECWLLFMTVYLNRVEHLKYFVSKILVLSLPECLYIANITNNSKISSAVLNFMQNAETLTMISQDKYIDSRIVCVSVFNDFINQYITKKNNKIF